MNKTLPKIIFALIGILLMVSACTEPEEFDNVLIGTWKHTDYQTGDWEKITFDEDLDYRLINYNATTLQTVAIEGDYAFTDTTFTLKSRGKTTKNIQFKYALKDNYLLVYPGKVYFRQ